MMDIGMYGNHNSNYHSPSSTNPDLGINVYNTYFTQTNHHHFQYNYANGLQVAPNSTESNGYDFGTSQGNVVGNTNQSTYAHPHLYSPTAAEYGITTTQQNTASNSPSNTEAYYENDNSSQSYYGQTPGPDPTHIINSENGLSYTNLDCVYGQNPGYIATQSGEIIEDPLIQGQSWHPHQHLQHHVYPAIENNSSQISIDPLILQNRQTQQQQQQQQLHSPGNNQVRLISPESNSNGSNQGNGQSANQGNSVPTYKWMQLKRNVPKPQGEFEFFDILEILKITRKIAHFSFTNHFAEYLFKQNIF